MKFHTEHKNCNFTNKTFNFKLCYGGGGSGAFWGLRASIFMVFPFEKLIYVVVAVV